MKDPCASIRKKLRAIAELRYAAIPTIFDIKGHIISGIHSEIQKEFPHWQTDIGSVTFLDNLNQPTREFQIALKRTSIIIEDPGTIQEFVDKTNKFLGLVYEQIGKYISKLSRIGVRLIEIAVDPKRNDFQEIVAEMTSRFLTLPRDLAVKPTDALVNIIHDKGMYHAGPVKKGEPWISQMFKETEKNVPASGIGIDVDSYTNEVDITRKEDLQKAFLSVYGLSKAVEESLLRHQGLIDGREA